MSQENIELYRRLQERVNAGDIEGELTLIHPDFELFARSDDPEIGVFRGREGWRQLAASDNDVFDHYRFGVEEYIDAGHCLVIVGRVRGTARSSGIQLEDFEALEPPEARSGDFATAWPSNAASTGPGSRPRSRRAVGVALTTYEREPDASTRTQTRNFP